MENKLIIVEGLTGSGKSILAHFLARQIAYQGISVDWLHEGEIDHPLSVEYEKDIEKYTGQTLTRWRSFVEQIASSDQVVVVEACFLNNLVETLMVENFDKESIFKFVHTLEKIIAPLNPVLLYLSHDDIVSALERNFKNRGKRFEDFVIKFAVNTAYALEKGYQGYQGMLRFWEDFVNLTDQVYNQFPYPKIRLDTSGEEWELVHQQALASLQIPLTSERGITPEAAESIAGVYLDTVKDRQFKVTARHEGLYINFFHTVYTRLIPKTETTFWTEGWHFEISFEKLYTGEVMMTFGGEDIDYLKLVGTVAVKRNL